LDPSIRDILKSTLKQECLRELQSAVFNSWNHLIDSALRVETLI
jgi:hypothetical protein